MSKFSNKNNFENGTSEGIYQKNRQRDYYRKMESKI